MEIIRLENTIIKRKLINKIVMLNMDIPAI